MKKGALAILIECAEAYMRLDVEQDDMRKHRDELVAKKTSSATPTPAAASAAAPEAAKPPKPILKRPAGTVKSSQAKSPK
eukprot:12278356-Alexandrium_andersonii.AAC.1